MRLGKVCALCGLLCFVLTSNIFFAYAGEWKEFLRPQSLDKIYAGAIPAQIRSNFKEYAQTIAECKECHVSCINFDKYKSILDDKFIIIGIFDNVFGGYFVPVVVGSNVDFTIYRLWLYEVDKSIYQLREIENISGQFTVGEVDEIVAVFNDNYKKYWL